MPSATTTSRRHATTLGRAALLSLTAVVLSSCGARPADLDALPPIDATVTFKTIEKGEEVRYRVEVTYPDDPDLFKVDLPDDANREQKDEAREYVRYAGFECWLNVEPDDYEYVQLGDTIPLGHPANDDRGFYGEVPGRANRLETSRPAASSRRASTPRRQRDDPSKLTPPPASRPHTLAGAVAGPVRPLTVSSSPTNRRRPCPAPHPPYDAPRPPSSQRSPRPPSCPAAPPRSTPPSTRPSPSRPSRARASRSPAAGSP